MTSLAQAYVLEMAKPIARAQELSTSGAQGARGENVVEFEGPLRPQDIILKCLKEGKSLDEIAELTSLPRVQVEKIARCDWMRQQMEEEAREGNTDSLRSLVRGSVFTAAMEHRRMLESSLVKDSVKLQAIRLAYEFSMTPAKDQDFGGKRRTDATPEQALKRLEELQREIQVRKDALARPL